MAKKVKKYVVHKKLEQPVHNLIGYAVLLALTVVTYILVTRVYQ